MYRTAFKTRTPLPMPASIQIAPAHQICVCVPDLNDGMLSSFANGVKEYFVAKGSSATIISSSMSRSRQTDLMASALENGSSGVILVPAPGTSIGDLRAFAQNDIPLVVAFEDVVGSSLAFVAPDFTGGAFEATMRLIMEGHSRIGFVGSRKSSSLSRCVWQGLQQALGQAGIPVDLKFAHFPGQIGFDLQHIADALSQSAVTAVFCVDRDFAGKLDEALHRLGPASIKAISVVTLAEQESPVIPGITQIRFDCRHLGQIAGSLLEDILRGEPSIDKVHVPARLD